MSRASKAFTYKSASCVLRWSGLKGVWIVYSVLATEPGQGHGTGLMRKVCEEADRLECSLGLRVRPYFYKRGEGLNKDQLILFYEKFGFQSVQDDLDGFMYRRPGMMSCFEASQDLQVL